MADKPIRSLVDMRFGPMLICKEAGTAPVEAGPPCHTGGPEARLPKWNPNHS
jgi:hypothetical protein